MPVPYHEPSTTLSPPPPPSKWGPYSNSNNFTANMVIILIILLCSFVLLLALNALIRYLLCHLRSPSSDPEKSPCPQTPGNVSEVGPILIFSASETNKTIIAGSEAECSICLAEFADGDRVRVLPVCNHGFHVGCIERWIVTKETCPTCRARCHVGVALA